jgi:hypothetical protein
VREESKMTSSPQFNFFEERLRCLQADITGLSRSHQNLQRSLDGMRSEMNQRFDALDARFSTMEARLETMIEEMRRFFGRYEHIDADRQP